MTDKLINSALQPVTPQVPAARPAPGQRQVPGAEFRRVLAEELARGSGIKFSAHAERRLASRQIPFTAEDMRKLSAAVERAAAKGARESLILMQDLALIVSIVNRTVVTAIDGPSLKENVFTNIDSAVIT
ncbi:MAG: TIGR02530 family flagellar biosynthesis protein [Bacillota bacterium]|nr:TIGR02530 family flagellar biosynthesis protein [Bacillota bacterium]